MGAVYHFARLHKTAGGSFRRHLRELFPPEEICPHMFEFELNDDTELDRYRFFDGHISLPGLASRIVRDHVIFLLREPAERIQSAYWFWRDLAAKAKNRDHPLLQLAGRLTLLEFVTSTNLLIRDSIWNAQTRFIAGGRFGDSDHTRTCVIGPDLSPEALLAAAKENIDQAYFVAVTEHLAESVEMIFRKHGREPPASVIWKNRGKERSQAPASTAQEIKAIEAIIDLDRQIYDYAVARFAADRRLVGADDSHQLVKADAESTSR